MQDHGEGDADADVYLTVGELSEMLSVPKNTLYQWNSRGTGPRHLRLGKYVRYRASDVRQWIAEQESTTPRNRR